ncbi:MAG: glycosyltransferase family A protein [Deltaproteobacteria bacterium]
MSNPFLTCIVLSHNKPAYVLEAIASLTAQTFENWNAIVFDSGVLFDQGFFRDAPVMADPRIRLIRSWETEELRRTKTIASWCFNECFRKNLVQGKYVTYLCDDDILYPDAFAAFHQYVDDHPGTMAMYGSVDMTFVDDRGEKLFFQEIVANEQKGRCCNGGPLDKRVDYLQLCHHIDVLKSFHSDEYWPENREVMRHADGIFLEMIGDHFPIVPVLAKIGENRKVPESLNEGGEILKTHVEMCRKAHADRRLRERLGVLGRVLIRSGVADWYRSFARR